MLLWRGEILEHWCCTLINEFSVLLPEQVASHGALQHLAFWLAVGQVAMLGERALCLSVHGLSYSHRRNLLSPMPRCFLHWGSLSPPASWAVESGELRTQTINFSTLPQFSPLNLWEKRHALHDFLFYLISGRNRVYQHHCPMLKPMVRAILSYSTCT